MQLELRCACCISCLENLEKCECGTNNMASKKKCWGRALIHFVSVRCVPQKLLTLKECGKALVVKVHNCYSICVPKSPYNLMNMH